MGNHDSYSDWDVRMNLKTSQPRLRLWGAEVKTKRADETRSSFCVTSHYRCRNASVGIPRGVSLRAKS